jgi:hypothetical protein
MESLNKIMDEIPWKKIKMSFNKIQYKILPPQEKSRGQRKHCQSSLDMCLGKREWENEGPEDSH